MKSVQALLSVFGLAAAVQATGWNATSTAGTGVSYVTETVATYTTFCPAATTITTNGKTYTATASQTLTITDCPCKVTKPVSPPTPTGVAPPPAGNATVITTVLTAYTTVCPVATSVIQGNQTYTATASQTLTITNCPCTVSYPATTSTTVITTITTYCPSSTVLTFGSSTYSVTSVGTQTIPVTSVSTGPASPPTPAPVAPGTTPGASAPATNKPTSPPASTTGPLQANSGAKAASGFGAVVAGFLAMLL